MINQFEPEELEMSICGSPILDFEALESATKYQDGFTSESPTVKLLWEILAEFTEAEKKQFLFFCTGCDRAPINGLGHMKFYISKHGSDLDQLPSVHTCFNHLLLPEYLEKDHFRDKLKQAIENAEGFGLI